MVESLVEQLKTDIARTLAASHLLQRRENTLRHAGALVDVYRLSSAYNALSTPEEFA